MIDRSTSRRGITLAALVAGVFAGAPEARALGSDTSKVEAILLRASKSDARALGTLAQDLLELGGGVVPTLVDALALEARLPASATPATAPESTPTEAESRKLAPQSRARTWTSNTRARVLLNAFELMGGARWRPVLEERLHASPGPPLLAAVFAIAGSCGYAQDLPLVVRAAGLDAEALHWDDFEAATTRILLRDRGAFTAIDGEMGTIPIELRMCVVRAVEATKLPAAAPVLAHWIDTKRDIRFGCLPYLSRLSLALDKPIQADVLASVRSLVESGDSQTLREAILCAGRLEDCAAIPALIRWLREGERGVRQDALWALRNITHMGLGEDANAWNGWLSNETKWWELESQDQFQWLESGTKAQKVAILCKISCLHAWRDRLAVEVAVALDDLDPDIALMAAAELKRLDSRLAVQRLADALDRPEVRVVAAAHAALESILKRELPVDTGACRDALATAR